MSSDRKKILRFVGSTIFIILVMAMLLLPRFIAETKNKNVEIALPYSSVASLSRKYGYTFENLLDRLKSAGVTTIILEEMTPSELEEEIGSIFFTASDYRRLNLLDVITEGSLIKPWTFVFPSNAELLANYIKEILVKNYGFVNPRMQKVGNRIFLYAQQQREKSSYYTAITPDTPLGFSIDKVRGVASYGFQLAFEPSTSDLNYIMNCVDALAKISSDKKNSAPIIRYPVVLLPPKPTLADNLRPSLGDKTSQPVVSPQFLREEIVSKFYYVDFEFSSDNGVLKKFFDPYSSIKGHRLPSGSNASFLGDESKTTIKRYIRAVRERGVRFLVVKLNEDLGVDENISAIKSLSRALKKIGLRINPPAVPISTLYPYPFADFAHQEPYTVVVLRKILTFFIAFVAPAFLIYNFKRQIENARNTLTPMVRALILFFKSNVVIIGVALLISSFVSSPVFASGSFELPCGIKFLLAGSLIVAVLFGVFEADELKSFILSQARVWHIGIGIVIVLALNIMLARSGNDGGAWSLALELRAREFLENIFVWARPRWKEILIGQPALYLAFRFNKKFLLIGGALGVVSVINTFLHIHTPLGISIYRTVGGIILGLMVGIIIDFIIIKKDKISINVFESVRRKVVN